MMSHDVRIRIEPNGDFLVRPVSDYARDWVEEHVVAPLEWCGAIYIEERFAPDLLRGMHSAGLSIGEEEIHD